ncbi:MAG: type II toxin-antitoxin system RelE/ParE family toxin [Bacteroidota bacterium]
MRLVYTEQALVSLEEALEFIAIKVSHEKLIEIRDRILDHADTLLLQPLKGQKEPFLEHLGLGHRRLVESHYKIIYRVVSEYIYITDIFDSRQDPDKMKG